MVTEGSGHGLPKPPREHGALIVEAGELRERGARQTCGGGGIEGGERVGDHGLEEQSTHGGQIKEGDQGGGWVEGAWLPKALDPPLGEPVGLVQRAQARQHAAMDRALVAHIPAWRARLEQREHGGREMLGQVRKEGAGVSASLGERVKEQPASGGLVSPVMEWHRQQSCGVFGVCGQGGGHSRPIELVVAHQCIEAALAYHAHPAHESGRRGGAGQRDSLGRLPGVRRGGGAAAHHFECLGIGRRAPKPRDGDGVGLSKENDRDGFRRQRGLEIGEYAAGHPGDGVGREGAVAQCHRPTSQDVLGVGHARRGLGQQQVHKGVELVWPVLGGGRLGDLEDLL